jgi:hypothetical protein
MTEYFQPALHQRRAIRALLAAPCCALLAKPGTGKTAIALAVLKITKAPALVVAPLTPAITTWPNEIAKWAQFSGIDFAIAHGKHKEAAFGHRITIINPEGLKWLFQNAYLLKPKRTLIVDESQGFKKWSSKRTKIMRKLAPMFARRHTMTGTPVAKTLLAWFPQQYIVDLGKSFGDKITHFQRKYFHPGGFKNYDWVPFEDTGEKLAGLSRSRAHVAENVEYKTPGLHFIDATVPLPASVKKTYNRMKRTFSVDLLEDTVTAIDMRQKYNKLRQIAAGAVYAENDDGDRYYETLHSAKIERLKSIVEEYGDPMVVVYLYDFELDALRSSFIGYKCAEINGYAKKAEKQQAEKAWQSGKLDLLFVHPKSGGIGVNLHEGGRAMAILSLPDDPELYGQVIFRIDRMGARGVGIVYRLMAEKTVEDEVVLPRLLHRGKMQDLFIEHCKGVQEV